MMDVNQEQRTPEEEVKQETTGTTAEATEAVKAGAEQPGQTEPVQETKAEEPKAEETPKVDPRDAKIADLEDQLLRLRAEYANYKRRTGEEKIMLGTFTTCQVVKEFLKVLDNFERAEQNLGEAAAGPVVEGMQKIRKQFDDTLKRLDVEEIKALNEKFDPNLHEAVMRGENPELEEDTIDQVFEKGYKLREQVIRHSKVRVISK